MNKAFLFELLRTGSVSGNEVELEKKIYDYMQDKADQVTVDELGNVTAIVNPEASFKVLLAGHADEIGLMVSAVGNDGMLMVTKIGGIYTTTYPGHKVRIYTKNGVIYGAVANSREIAKNKDLEASDLRIDIGAKDREDALKYVELGDTVTFDTDVRELLNDCISGRALDDRIGAFIVMEALAEARFNYQTFCMFDTLIQTHWKKHNTLIGFAMDHGCHEVQDGSGRGTHSDNTPEDRNIVHLYKIHPASK